MNLSRFGRAVPLLLGLSACSWFFANDAVAQELHWQTILGIKESGDVVGVGSGAITVGAPWETLGVAFAQRLEASDRDTCGAQH